MKQIADIIEGHPLFHASPTDSVRSAAQMVSDEEIGAVAMLDSGRLVGLLSERELMSRVVARGLNPEKTAVKDVMTKSIVVAQADDDVDAALQKMFDIGCRHLPVVEKGNLIGMLSLRDLLIADDDTQRKRASFLNELVTYSPDYES